MSDHNGELDGLPLFWRSAETPGGPAAGSAAAGASAAAAGAATHGAATGSAAPAPVLYLHGVPTNSDDWIPFLERTGGLAPDLPGFGRSGKPGSLNYTIEEYDRFVERFLDLLGVERVSLVVHDWGGVGLAFAQRLPERVQKLVIVNAVPFLPGYRWHRTARMWRTRGLGELVMGATSSFTLRLSSRESNAAPGPMPDHWLSTVMDHFDQGTQRAILRLYRSSPPEVLERAGAGLSQLQVPALVVWGGRDPYIDARFGREYAAALPQAELAEYPDAGHWGWLDRPDMIDRVAGFLSAA